MTQSRTKVKTVILGAGFGGLGMGAQMKRAGDEDFVILERNDRIGGVWQQNDYPGAACDIQAIGPELAVEGLDEAVVRRLAGPREVEHHALLLPTGRDPD